MEKGNLKLADGGVRCLYAETSQRENSSDEKRASEREGTRKPDTTNAESAVIFGNANENFKAPFGARNYVDSFSLI